MRTTKSRAVRILMRASLLVCVSVFLHDPSLAQDTSTNFAECKDLNWMPLGFRNQGECVSILANGGMIWHLADDFLLSPDQDNPNPDSNGNADVWWFQYNAGGLSRDPELFVLLPNFTVVDPNRQQWDDGFPSPSPFPEIGLIIGLETMIVHPDFDQLVVTGWQSPVAGTVNIRGAFRHIGGGGNGVRWFVDHDDGVNVVTLASGVLDVDGSADFGFDLTADVNVGDFLDFSVDPRPSIGPGDADFDSTLMDLTISGPLPLTED